MINLIKNELIKIFKKTSTYIILSITVCFIILSNFLYGRFSSNQIIYDSELKFLEQEVSTLQTTDPSYVNDKSRLEELKLMEKYGYDSWQTYIIQNTLSSYIYDINYYTYSTEEDKDEKTFNKAKEEYDNIIKLFDNDDWKSFVELELKDVNENIKLINSSLSETSNKEDLRELNINLYNLNLKKQALEWRLKYNINYGNTFSNNCIENYIISSISVYEYEHSSTENKNNYDQKQMYYNSLSDSQTSKYYIENNITSVSNSDNRHILINLFSEYELFIIIFMVMIAGAIVSDEFNKGTIKLLLVRPYSRIKILLSKFIVCIIMLILFVIFVSIAQFIIGGLMLGFESISVPDIVYNFNTKQVEAIGIAKSIGISFLAKLPMYILLLTLAFACSTIFSNTALSITITILGYMGSSIINLLANTYKIQFIKYFVTPNWDLTSRLFGGLPEFEGLTNIFSMIVCLVYFAIMIILSFTFFKKKNIKNI